MKDLTFYLDKDGLLWSAFQTETAQIINGASLTAYEFRFLFNFERSTRSAELQKMRERVATVGSTRFKKQNQSNRFAGVTHEQANARRRRQIEKGIIKVTEKV